MTSGDSAPSRSSHPVAVSCSAVVGPSEGAGVASVADAGRRLARAVESVLRPARSNRMVKRWQARPSTVSRAAEVTTPCPHSGRVA